MDSLLVIDDDEGVRIAVKEVLESDECRVLLADCATTGLKLLAEENPLVVLLDIRLGNESGLSLFEQIRRVAPKVLVIFITGHGTAELAIETIKMGAYDYLPKPLDYEQLQSVIGQALKISRLMRLPTVVDSNDLRNETAERLIGTSPAMQPICKQIGRVAPQDVNVLILGESGTGKELVARAIYQHSRRSHAPYLAINCAAIPEALLESELFGHEQGAFTGADRRRIGKFEQCHNGTIFLDEVGDMSLATQAKILRLLQDGQFQRVGGNESLSTNVRIISATNRNLEPLIQKGKFRLDLFYRLRGVSLHLPPLRERREDIPELAHYFMFRFNRQLGTDVRSISPEAIERMQAYSWPGNIRELQGAIREALILSTGPALLPEFFPFDLLHERFSSDEDKTEVNPVSHDAWSELGRQIQTLVADGQGDVYRRALQHFDKLLIDVAMNRTHGFQGKAAELLGLSRPTLRAKLRSFGADVRSTHPPASNNGDAI